MHDAWEQFGSGLRVLVVDDEESVCIVLDEILQGTGFAVEMAASLEDARRRLGSAESAAENAQEIAAADGGVPDPIAVPFDLVITDKNLPDGSGLDLARDLAGTKCEVVLITGYANVASAVEAFQLEIADYLLKPFDSLDLVLARLRRVTNGILLERRNDELVLELTRKNEALESMVLRDPLTGLYNHAFLQEFIERESLRSRRNGFELGLVLVDIDGFDEVNKTHGYQIGDKLIRRVSEVINGTGRGSDFAFHIREHEIAARYGGDVLALVLPETSKSGVAIRAERLRSILQEFDFYGEGLPPVTVSIGMAAFPVDGGNRPELIAAADAALASAKKRGRNQMMAYSPVLVGAGKSQALDKEVGRLLALERSIDEHAFRFVYQPIVDAQTTEILAYEALCRPTDPAFPSPLDLIASAEDAGRVADLGRALREVAVGPLDRLPEPTLLFLNVHPLELGEKLLGDESAVLPWARRIVLEITENTALKKFDQVREVMTRLKAKGFRIALDDLGAGYASLNSLALLDPDFVKLDMEMMRGIHSDSRSARLLKHILEYTKEEGIRVVAEGIETAEERDVVRDLGCHLIQGYFYSRPAEPFCKVVSG